MLGHVIMQSGVTVRDRTPGHVRTCHHTICSQDTKNYLPTMSDIQIIKNKKDELQVSTSCFWCDVNNELKF